MKTGISRFNSKFEVFLPGVPETISVYHKGAHLTNETDIFSGTSLRTVNTWHYQLHNSFCVYSLYTATQNFVSISGYRKPEQHHFLLNLTTELCMWQ